MSEPKPTKISPLFSWRGAICESGLPSTARLVAFTLSLHMSERGDSCYPGIDKLADESGLSRTAVKTGLKKLEDFGYIEVEHLRGRGYSNRYKTSIPEKGHEPPVSAKKGHVRAIKGSPGDREDVKEDVSTFKPNGLKASDLVGFYVDECNSQNKKALVAKKGQVAARVKKLLGAGVSATDIQAGIWESIRRNRPESLENVIAEASGGGVRQNGHMSNTEAIDDGFRQMGVKI